MRTGIYNFSSGPATLPEPVLLQVQQELLNWQQSGVSMLEIYHRGKEFIELAAKITDNLKKLLQVPDNFKILFMQGGGRAQFSAIPLNLLGSRQKASYAVTGLWSSLAQTEAERYASVEIATHSGANNFTDIAPLTSWQIAEDSAYLHYTDNETAHGLEFQQPPMPAGRENLIVVSDMSSNILSRPIDFTKVGLAYACAQKNMGAAGLTVVIVREDLVGKAALQTPGILNYEQYVKMDSMPNTPPCFIWYVLGLVVEWVIAEGGLVEMERRSCARSQKLYQFIDQSSLYSNPVVSSYRSRMNVVFDLADSALNESFINGAKDTGLLYVKGHTARGGMRVGLYNAMPMAGVEALIDYMQEFERRA